MEKEPITIKRASKDERTVHLCDRCKKPLDIPVETESVYVYDGVDCRLVHPECVISGDLYIWGEISVLDKSELSKVEVDVGKPRVGKVDESGVMIYDV